MPRGVYKRKKGRRKKGLRLRERSVPATGSPVRNSGIQFAVAVTLNQGGKRMTVGQLVAELSKLPQDATIASLQVANTVDADAVAKIAGGAKSQTAVIGA